MAFKPADLELFIWQYDDLDRGKPTSIIFNDETSVENIPAIVISNYSPISRLVFEPPTKDEVSTANILRNILYSTGTKNIKAVAVNYCEKCILGISIRD